MTPPFATRASSNAKRLVIATIRVASSVMSANGSPALGGSTAIGNVLPLDTKAFTTSEPVIVRL
jgi:hypothetical protein